MPPAAEGALTTSSSEDGATERLWPKAGLGDAKQREYWRRYDEEKTISRGRETRHRIVRAKEMLAKIGETDPRPIYPLHALVRSCLTGSAAPGTEDLLDDIVEVEPSIDPIFVLYMATTGAQRRSARSFGLPAVDEAVRRFLEFCPGNLLVTKETLEAGHVGVAKRGESINKALSSAGVGLEFVPPELAKDDPCRVVLSVGKSNLSVKVCTLAQQSGPFSTGAALHCWPEKTIIRRPPLRPDEAVEALAECEGAGIAIDDPDGIAEPMEALVRRSVAVHEVRGMPGLCELAEGQREGSPVKRRQLSCGAGVRVARERERHGDRVAVAESVADVARMEDAPESLDEKLLPPQRGVVGVHLATEYGFVNASQVATGKTAMSLRGARQKAKSTPCYRALIVVQAALREQWVEETQDPDGEQFFPEAEILVPEGSRIGRQLVRFEHETGERPGLIFITYEQARKCVSDLEALTYDEIYVDEADMLCNTSQLERALWRLRARAAVGIPNTGTPIGRELIELDRIVAWAREDQRARREARVGRSYGGFDTLSADRLQAAFGPVVQRVTRAEMREYMPEVGDVETLRISPGEKQLALIRALDVEIARLFAEVMERVKAAEAKGSKLAEAARKELAQVRGIMLGGVTVARMAKDPLSLRTSEAQVAKLVEANGLLSAAIEEGSPSRQIVAQTMAEAAREGEQVLCFAEFTSHLALLRQELEEEYGVEAGIFAGGQWKADRDVAKRRFRAGELSVILMGPVGQKGQNVQPAASEAVALHYDLPWEPRRFEQRVGRGARPGAAPDEIAVLVPMLRHSIEERVAEILLPRSAKAIAALSREKGSEPLAVQLEAIAGELAEDAEASAQIRVCEAIFREHSTAQPIAA